MDQNSKTLKIDLFLPILIHQTHLYVENSVLFVNELQYNDIASAVFGSHSVKFLI